MSSQRELYSPRIDWCGFANSTRTSGYLISPLVSSMAVEPTGPCRIFRVTILNAPLSFLEDKTNPFQLVINHFLIWKRTDFLFLWRSLSRAISLSNLEACQLVNLILAYVILKEKTPVHLLGSLAVSSAVSQDGFSCLWSGYCKLCFLKKSKQFSLSWRIMNGKKSFTFQGNWKGILTFFLISLWELEICTSIHNL